MVEKPICPDCTEVNIEECDDTLCDIVVPAECVEVGRDLSCLNLEAGATLDEVLGQLCTLTGTNLAVEVTEHGGNDACPDGGATVSIGIDTSGDGGIDNLLVTFDLCNGDDGVDGVSQVVEVNTIAPGATCSNGGIQVTVDGVDYFLCNGINGQDATPCECPETPVVDYTCLEALGVTIGDNPQQAIVNVLCDLITQMGGVNLQVADHIYNIEVGETLTINLLNGSTIPPGDTVTGVTLLGLQSGAVDYNGEGTVVSVDGELDITGLSAGSDNRTYQVDTDAPGSASASVQINVTEPVVVSFWDAITPTICFYRHGQNDSFEFALPINPSATDIFGTITISTGKATCYNEDPDSPGLCGVTPAVNIVVPVVGTLIGAGSGYTITDNDVRTGHVEIFPDATNVTCGCSTPPEKVWQGELVAIRLDLTILTPLGNASVDQWYYIPQMSYPADYPHTTQQYCVANPNIV